MGGREGGRSIPRVARSDEDEDFAMFYHLVVSTFGTTTADWGFSGSHSMLILHIAAYFASHDHAGALAW